MKDADGNVTTPATWFPAPPGWFFFGSGGGTSFVFEQPKWQKGIVPDAIANVPGTAARAVPDVSMLGDPITGFKIGQTDPATGAYSEFAIGGTSLSCPLFAATMALAQQNAKQEVRLRQPAASTRSADGVPRHRAGRAAAGGRAAGRHRGGHRLPGADDQDGGRLDNVTGLGVPNGAAFIKAIK